MKMRMTFLASVLLFFCGPVRAQEDSHAHAHHEMTDLGKVDFPTSCSAAVQNSFERGVALLHSFWYEAAQSQFEDVLHKDASCAMAHWGVAMSLYHPLWDRPGADILGKGRAALEAAASAGEKTPREKEYIAALAVFYKGTDSGDHLARAADYAKAMEQIYLHYPQDREAAIFYALSLLGSEPPHDPGFPTRLKAAAVLEKVFREAPDHPGVAHYLIHSYDRPQLAAQGLAAARAYAKIAPAAPHALHMPSHIFNRVGLWQDTIASNLASVAATRKSAMGHMGDASHQLHAMDFLSYAYLQIGREADAAKTLEEVKGLSGMEQEEMNYMLAELPSRYALEMRHWTEAAALLAPSGSKAGIAAITYRARIIGNARSGNAAKAREDLKQLETLQQTAQQYVRGYPAADRNVDWQEAKAWVEYAEGNVDQALKDMRATADLEEKDGPAQLAIPAREMLADMLLEKNRTAEALTEYEGALRVAPGRFGGLYGAARAAELAGKPDQAATFYAQLLKNCEGGAHSDRPELKQARALVAKR
jgi:tetratricopeptide (TPR) repeat protein